MRTFWVLLRKELREQVRTNRLLGIGVVFLIFGIASPLLARFMAEILAAAGPDLQITLPPPTPDDAVEQFLKNFSQFGPLVAILLAMGAVARERERGTLAFVLTKPVNRGAFLAAKFVALAATLLLPLLLAAAAAWAYTAGLLGRLPLGGYAAMVGLLFLSILVYAGITFLASTLLPSALPAAGVGIAAFVGLAILGVVPRLGRLTPEGLIGPAHALGVGQPAAELAVPVLANLGLLLAVLALAWWSFRRQEIGG